MLNYTFKETLRLQTDMVIKIQSEWSSELPAKVFSIKPNCAVGPFELPFLCSPHAETLGAHQRKCVKLPKDGV